MGLKTMSFSSTKFGYKEIKSRKIIRHPRFYQLENLLIDLNSKT